MAEERGYRIAWDESAEIPGQTEAERRWLVQIPGARGHGFVQAPDRIGVYLARSEANEYGQRLLALPTAKLLQSGDKECSVSIDPADLDAAAAVIGARRKRTLSTEHRAKAVAALAPFRVAKGAASGAL